MKGEKDASQIIRRCHLINGPNVGSNRYPWREKEEEEEELVVLSCQPRSNLTASHMDLCPPGFALNEKDGSSGKSGDQGSPKARSGMRVRDEERPRPDCAHFAYIHTYILHTWEPGGGQCISMRVSLMGTELVRARVGHPIEQNKNRPLSTRSNPINQVSETWLSAGKKKEQLGEKWQRLWQQARKH